MIGVLEPPASGTDFGIWGGPDLLRNSTTVDLVNELAFLLGAREEVAGRDLAHFAGVSGFASGSLTMAGKLQTV